MNLVYIFILNMVKIVDFMPVAWAYVEKQISPALSYDHQTVAETKTNTSKNVFVIKTKKKKKCLFQLPSAQNPIGG